MPLALIIILGAVGALAYGFSAGYFKASDLVAGDNIMGLPDTDAANQGGVYRRDYDDAFQYAATKWGVPFALLKAHALRESSLDSSVYRMEPSGQTGHNDVCPGKASYGLMQILWWKGSNRFADYGWNDDNIGEGSILYVPDVNCDIAAGLIAANWKISGNIRDTINMYNTGVSESVRRAPNSYVDNVLSNYSTLVKGKVV